MSLTESEIKERLGLTNLMAGYPWKRGSGRTTAILVELLVKVSAGEPVAIVAHTVRSAAQLVQQAKLYADDLGLDRGLICQIDSAAQLLGRHPRPTIFRDYFWGGR